MSDLWLNIRFWIFHLQAGSREWWRLELGRNYYHLKRWQLFAVYRIDRPRSYIGGRAETNNNQ